MRRPGFRDFFTALWGEDKPPFAWQEQLATRVLERSKSNGDSNECSPWPEAIALPTASGKTACMDIAVFALAAEASRMDAGQPITAPRRIFFVVDRRVIVDEAYDRAKEIANKLEGAKEGILKTVADNLRRISHDKAIGFDDESPLAVHILRGGMYRSESWARNPLQPAIIASTVDQVGSRLLFRAYGRGAGTWPIYAGLVANDSLILLDEAHCAQPFMQTLHNVQMFRTWAEMPLERQFHPVVMSATPPPGLKDVFKDSSGQGVDSNHPLGKRQLARKSAVLRAVDKARGDVAIKELSKELAQAATRLVDQQLPAVVVFSNRVATARKVAAVLAGNRQDGEVILLTGRMRAADKEAVARRLRALELYSNRSSMRQLSSPVIVVATQTLEVGADLDFDGLVTECASLDALRQRFGRLNRMGRNVESRAEILIRGDQVNMTPKNRDPVYGQAISNTWQWLIQHKDAKGEVDFGIARLNRVLHKEECLRELNAPSKDAPVMLPAHVDCWAQTAPEPFPSPDVAVFLHGPQESAPDVQVCWRADLDLSSKETQSHALESLRLCPPSSVETLPVPIGVFKHWLAGSESTEDHSPDVEGVAVPGDDPTQLLNSGNRRVVRWQGVQTNRGDITSNPADIRPGEVLAIPTTHPGPPSQLGDLPAQAKESPDTLDIGDIAHRITRAKPILRLHPKVVSAWPNSLPAKAGTLSLLEDIEHKYEEDTSAVAEAVQKVLLALSVSEAPDRWRWLSDAATELKNEFPTAASVERACRLIGDQSLVLTGRRLVRRLTQEIDHFSDEDDASSSGISHQDGKPVPLRTHLPGVERFARWHAEGCGLSDELSSAIARAGLLHDVGKADRRFQSLLRGGLPWVAGEELAKSADMPNTRAARHRARHASGYPEGGRHELLSVRMAESAPALLPERKELRDLVLHLVASHHGRCRPFAPVVTDNELVQTNYELCGHKMSWPGPTDLERLDSGVADRYWRLSRRYGWWGLAWLEALLRLADWRRSEWEEAHGAGD